MDFELKEEIVENWLTRLAVCLLGVLLLPMLTFGICVSDLPVCEYAETAWAFGYSCGTWFTFDAEMEEVVSEAASRSDGAHIERTFVLRKKDLDSAWNLVRVVRRGEVSSDERVEVVGRKPGVVIVVE